MNPWTRLCRRAMLARLSRLDHGRLILREPDTAHRFGGDRAGPPHADVEVTDPRFFAAVTTGGHVGAAEAYARGWWTTDDLTAVVTLFLANRSALDGLETGSARLVQPLRAVAHWFNRNTRTGSRRNITAHYDLGNEFFARFLDETLTYSCGIFEQPEATLREASIAKYELLCRKLDLGPAHRVLEIGSGWGGFALYAAREYGCAVTTTTISREQYRVARERVAAAGLADRVTVLNRDYRDLEGTYDRLVSIEMIEAVGHQYLPTFFEQCASRLAPDGIAAIQAITIQDRYYESARREVDFIKRYIFPGSCIPAVSVLTRAAAATDLRLVDLEDIGPHYAETLRRWRDRFQRNWPTIRALGFDDYFRRIWEFYFCYCEGGFATGTLGNAHLVFAKPEARLGLTHRARRWATA